MWFSIVGLKYFLFRIANKLIAYVWFSINIKSYKMFHINTVNIKHTVSINI